MIKRFENKKDKKEARIKFSKDEVFLTAHEAIKAMDSPLSVEELFCSAEELARYLLTNNLDEPALVEYEIDELKEEAEDDTTAYLIMTLTLGKLSALRKKHPNAVAIARMLVSFCQAYDQFTPLLGKLSKKEHERWYYENKRVDLLSYELKTIDEVNPLDAMEVVNKIVDAAEGLTADAIQHVENALSEANDKCNHQLLEPLERLRTIRKKKSSTNINIEKVNDIHDCQNVHASIN